jgi:hypothetical protein
MRLIPALLLCTVLLAQTGSTIEYTKDGRFRMPKDYREWTYLTSGLAMGYDPGAKDPANPWFDNVFVNPSSYKSFLKTGTWPDKTVLVLEFRGSDNHASITTTGRSQTAVMGYEVHVKDASHGGWAFYHIDKNAPDGPLTPKTADCYSCHEKNGSVDTTFVQYYPTLTDVAKAHGTYKEVH